MRQKPDSFPVWIKAAFAAAICALLVFPAWAQKAGKPGKAGKGKTVISDTPWDPVRLIEDASKVIYGSDDRLDVYEETDPQRLTWANSTCALVDRGQLTDNGNGTFELRTGSYTVEGANPCPGEAFAGQPTAAFCTGFMVGSDLIATAGHCINRADLPDIRFVFHFQMADATTPITTFIPSQIYTPVELVGHRQKDFYDYAVVRVDRPITAPGAQILEVRRVGEVEVGMPLGVIGHPSGLPMKIAFGPETTVRESVHPVFFLANVDTYGGNSGSPIFNAETGLVEGILVTGAPDFIQERDCFRSNELEDDQANEGVSRSVTFADFIPGNLGQLDIGRPRLGCEDTIVVALSDMNIAGTGSAEVFVTTSGGDAESLLLAENPVEGTFSGAITVLGGAAFSSSGIVEVLEGETVSVTYEDADDGSGLPATVVAMATIDCTPPVISDVVVDSITGLGATVFFSTDELCAGTIRVGTECGVLDIEATGQLTTTHAVRVTGLTPETGYFFEVTASDEANNATTDDGGGACYSFATTAFIDYFTEAFLDLVTDFENLSLTLTPDASASGYRACVTTATTFPSDTNCGRRLFLGDDDFARFRLSEGNAVALYGHSYTEFFVGSNGYITFGAGDTSYDVADFASHFSLPRVSGYFSDLYPPAGGRIKVTEFDDRVAVTFEDVPDFSLDIQSFQIELFFDGAIRLTWLVSTRPFGIIGLSDGQGIPIDFDASDISAYDTCASDVYGEAQCQNLGCNGAGRSAGGPSPDGYGDLAAMALTLLALAATGLRRNRAIP